MENPKFRHGVSFSVEHIEGQDVLLVKDDLRIAPPLVFHLGVAPVLSALDGKSSSDEIVERFSSYGLTDDIMQQLLSSLREGLFLDSSEFHQKINNHPLTD